MLKSQANFSIQANGVDPDQTRLLLKERMLCQHRLLHLDATITDSSIRANSVGPDQTAPLAVISRRAKAMISYFTGA